MTAYAVPAAASWAVLGFCLAELPLAGAALIGIVAYGCCYGMTELAGSGGLRAPGRRWQVTQSMMINASPWRRVLVWGAILGPGFLTLNPYAGFGVLPLAVAAMRASGIGACVALAVLIGLAHGTARAVALIRDIPEALPGLGQLDVLLKTVYWRRIDGAVLLCVAAAAAVTAVRYF